MVSEALRWDDDDREILRLALPALGALTAEPLYVLAVVNRRLLSHVAAATVRLPGSAKRAGSFCAYCDYAVVEPTLRVEAPLSRPA